MIPIKVCQIADIHQGLGYSGPNPSSRYDDIEKILNWTADRIIAEKVDLCLVCGDLYKDAKIMFDRGTDETICIGNWLRKLSNAGIEVIVISGTPSHDSVSGYKFLKQMGIPGVHIFTTPGISPWPGDKVKIACLPGLNRSMLMTQDEYKGLPPEQVHRIMTDKITQLCQGMSAQMPNDKPKILMAHMTYQNADKGFDDLMMQHEPLLTREAVAGFDLVCLGHIHRPQVIDDKVFYSGPIERLSFNEENITPGFYIHEIDTTPKETILPSPADAKYYSDIFLKHYDVQSRFIETPARRYVSLNWDESFVKDYIENSEAFIYQAVQDSIVRLRYSCSEEVAKQLNRKQLEQALYDAGSFFVSEIKGEIERTDRARDNSVTEGLSVGQALEKWCINQRIETEETQVLSAMINELMEG